MDRGRRYWLNGNIEYKTSYKNDIQTETQSTNIKYMEHKHSDTINN